MRSIRRKKRKVQDEFRTDLEPLFLMVEPVKIDFSKLTPEFMRQVYAQAVYLLKHGYDYTFTKEEIAEIHANNARIIKKQNMERTK